MKTKERKEEKRSRDEVVYTKETHRGQVNSCILFYLLIYFLRERGSMSRAEGQRERERES